MRSVVDKVRHHATHDEEQLKEANQETTDSTRRVLRHISRRQHSSRTEAETLDEPPDIKDRQVAVGERLHEAADEAGDGDSEQGGLTSLHVRKWARDESSTDGTGLHCGDEVAGQIGCGTWRAGVETKLTVRGRLGQYAPPSRGR